MPSSIITKDATDNIIDETDWNIAYFVKPANMSSLQLASELRVKTFMFPHVYEEFGLKGTFVNRLLQYISHSIEEHKSSHKTALIKNWLHNATSLSILQTAAHPGEQANRHTNSQDN